VAVPISTIQQRDPRESPNEKAHRRLALAMLGSVLPIVKGYCDRTGKEIHEVTGEDLQGMI
jgi:hypothetical protein